MAHRQTSEALLFGIGAQRFAADTGSVEAVLRVETVTRVPSAPDFVVGVIYRSGAVVPVVLLERMLAQPPREFRPADWVVIVRPNGGLLGIRVDAVFDVRPYPGNRARNEDSFIDLEFQSSGDSVSLLNLDYLFRTLSDAVRRGQSGGELTRSFET